MKPIGKAELANAVKTLGPLVPIYGREVTKEAVKELFPELMDKDEAFEWVSENFTPLDVFGEPQRPE